MNSSPLIRSIFPIPTVSPIPSRLEVIILRSLLVPLTKFVLLSLIFISQYAAARTIWLAGNHHETMTWDSMVCAQNSEVAPRRCHGRYNGEEVALDLTRIEMGVWTKKAAKKAVRFPDDPVSELSFANPIGLMRWSWNMGVVGCKGKAKHITTGLRCSAHYGSFQFMHAMSASEGVDAAVTKSEILAWVRYLLLVIQNETLNTGETFIEQSYCNYWAGQAEHGNPIADVMMPQGKIAFPCVVSRGEPWSIGSMFAFECKTNIYTCNVDLRPEKVKSKAIGSLLHLIQDSFSQGHALRGECCAGVPDKELAFYQCLEIKQFNAYKNQNKGRHKKADKKPVAGDSCKPEHAPGSESSVYDPITSGAWVLWQLKHKGDSGEITDKILNYFDQHIFSLAVDAGPSSQGEGF
ncbi:hypothetical protein TDB9533_00203 [Thalassocella blandensis]|nr:hypothetical protein TDB9533_00203 [Thalassocella blandensis]